MPLESAHDRSGEIIELKAMVVRAVKLLTHRQPDLSDLLAIWICQRVRELEGLSPCKVNFVPANLKGADEGVLAIGMGIQEKGLRRFGKGCSIVSSIHGGSAVLAVHRLLPEEDRDILLPLVMAVSDVVETGVTSLTKWTRAIEVAEDTKEQLFATSMWIVYQSLMAIYEDEKMLDVWSDIFSGFLVVGKEKVEAQKAKNRIDLTCNGVLAILPHNAPRAMTKVAYEEKGASMVLFSSEINHNSFTLGLSRKSGDELRYLNLTKMSLMLTAAFPNIFIASDGYMAGWTSKAPLRCSREQLFKMRDALIDLAKEIVPRLVALKGR
jgi:hypothetical protein